MMAGCDGVGSRDVYEYKASIGHLVIPWERFKVRDALVGPLVLE